MRHDWVHSTVLPPFSFQRRVHYFLLFLCLVSYCHVWFNIPSYSGRNKVEVVECVAPIKCSGEFWWSKTGTHLLMVPTTIICRCQCNRHATLQHQANTVMLHSKVEKSLSWVQTFLILDALFLNNVRNIPAYFLTLFLIVLFPLP